jgi:site-specific DNA-methyltransferase (adenine-specific)
MKVKLLKGNNIHLLRTLEPNSIDSVITDPPYGLEFMNKKWDYDVPSVEFWKEVYRVLKPGGHILSFGGTRTYHRMVVNIEDAGFEIRDCIQWIYGSGFPKSLNIGKTIDKLEGNQREVIGDNPNNRLNSKKGKESNNPSGYKDYPYNQITKGQTQWEGWGTGLKPANEPIVMARKPIDEDTIAKNVLEYGTGGINIDGCRVGTETIKSVYGGFTNALVDGRDKDTRKQWIENSKKENGQFNTNKNDGRFPANVILECTCDDIIKGEKGEVKKTNRNRSSMKDNGYGFGENIEAIDNYNDKGDIHTNPKCPCYIMDEQSGISISSGGKKEKSYGTTWKGLNTGNNLPKSIG